MAFNIRMGLPEMAIEPHPEHQKRGAYQRIKLSTLPSAKSEGH